MPLDITAIQTEIEQLDDQLGGLQIEDLLCMGLGEFCIFNLNHAELAMARWILWLALRGYKRRAEEMERTHQPCLHKTSASKLRVFEPGVSMVVRTRV